MILVETSLGRRRSAETKRKETIVTRRITYRINRERVNRRGTTYRIYKSTRVLVYLYERSGIAGARCRRSFFAISFLEIVDAFLANIYADRRILNIRTATSLTGGLFVIQVEELDLSVPRFRRPKHQTGHFRFG